MAASESYLRGLYVDAATAAPRSCGWNCRAQFLRIYAISTFFADWITCSSTILFLELLQRHTSARQGGTFHCASVLAIAGGALSAFLLCQRTPRGALNLRSRVRETEDVLRATAPSLLFVFFLDFSLRLHALGWPCLFGLILIPALLSAERHVARRIRQELHRRGYGLARAALYVSGQAREDTVADPAALLASGLKVVVTVRDQDALLSAPALSANRPAEFAAREEMVNPALLYTSGCDVLLIAGSRIISDELAGAITAASEETGVPAAFIDADNLADHCAAATGLERFQPIDSFSCLQGNRFMQLQRVLDIVVAGFLLFLLAPLFLIIAIAIRVDSPGPSFFIQERVGKNGRRFQILKFRSMFITAPHYAASPKRSSDPRITRVGRLLRRLGLDELPQLINVLKGDMSVVGPRPEMPFLVERHRALHRQRLRVKPGITGLWQLSPDRRHPIHENVHHDLYYIAHGNLFLDLAILVHTLFRATPGGI